MHVLTTSTCAITGGVAIVAHAAAASSWFTSHQFIVIELLLHECLVHYFKPSSNTTNNSRAIS